jgi:hypothetical protein
VAREQDELQRQAADGLTVRDEQAEAAQGGHGGKRHDEGRQPQVDDAEGVDGAEDDADDECDDDRRPDRRPARQHHRDDRAREADHGANRKIDAGGDDDEGLPHRHDRPHRILTQQILEIAEGREAVGRDRQSNPQHHEQG